MDYCNGDVLTLVLSLMRNSITNQFWLSLIMFFLIPMLILGLVVLSLFRNTLVDRYQVEHLTMLESIRGDSIDGKIEYLENVLMVYRDDPRLLGDVSITEYGSLNNEWRRIQSVFDLDIDIHTNSDFSEYDKDHVLWSQPYISPRNYELVITGVIGIDHDEATSLCIDLVLSTVMNNFKIESQRRHNNLLVMTKQGTIINFNRRVEEPIDYSPYFSIDELVYSEGDRKLINIEGNEFYLFFMALDNIDMYLISLLPKDVVDDEIRPFLKLISVVLFLSTVLMAFGIGIASKMMKRDMTNLLSYMTLISRGKYELKEANGKISDEFRLINNYLNSMLEVLTGNIQKLDELNCQNQELIDLRTTLLHIISHNASTPITILINNSRELLERNDQDEELIEILTASESIKSILDNTMVYLKLEEGVSSVSSQQISIKDMIVMILKTYTFRFKEKNLLVESEINENEIIGNMFLVRIILENLIDNAFKYSPHGGKITINSQYHDNSIELRIRDEGQGFSTEDIPRMYTRFQRLSARPTGGESSTGLGLYLIKKIMVTCGGNIILNTNYTCGAEFIITFPHKFSS